MLKKTIIWEFFTTVSFYQAVLSLYLMTLWAYRLRFWKDNVSFEKNLLEFIWKNDSKIISFYNWRSAIYNTLMFAWVRKNDEIIVNSYTCSVVCNWIIQAWWKIVYSDIEWETLSFDYKKLEKNININTKIVIIQHTFWKKAKNYEKIIKLCQEKWILTIEDCAHSLWNNSKYKWDFLIFSTWRDKVISSVTWWFLVINNKKYFKDIKNILVKPSVKLSLQNLSYNIVWYISYKTYDFLKLGKIIIFLSRKLNFITEILNKKEKIFEYKKFNLWLPNSLGYLAKKELSRLEKYTKIRIDNSKYYLENLKNPKIEILFKNLKNFNWFRFPIVLKNKNQKNRLYSYMKKNDILLWNYWSWQNVIPSWIDLKKAKYSLWSCKISEKLSKTILTLPNHKMINKKDLEKIVKILNKF